MFTFALGTATGDLVAEKLGMGYIVSLLLFLGIIMAVAVAHFQFGLNGAFSFWAVYVMTRPLGASLGDLLSQLPSAGGLGLGTTVTSALFLAIILGLVIYLTVTKRDVFPIRTRALTASFHSFDKLVKIIIK